MLSLARSLLLTVAALLMAAMSAPTLAAVPQKLNPADLYIRVSSWAELCANKEPAHARFWNVQVDVMADKAIAILRGQGASDAVIKQRAKEQGLWADGFMAGIDAQKDGTLCAMYRPNWGKMVARLEEETKGMKP